MFIYECIKLRGAGHITRVGETRDVTLFWCGTLIEAAVGISGRKFDSDINALLLVDRVYCCSCLVCVVILCVFVCTV